VAASGGKADAVPVAFVQPANGAVLDEGSLRSHCLEQLARFKVPERIVLVDAFPTVDSPNGPKVQRVRLREIAEALLRQERNEPRHGLQGQRHRSR
jgi:fatty-acyl-CoA synthase